jgi:hypothetical protein
VSPYESGIAAVVFRPLNVAFAWLLAGVATLVLAWIVDWTFVSWVWPEGVERLREVLAIDLARGIELARRQGGTEAAITDTANAFYRLVFQTTGIHQMGLRFGEAGTLSIPDTIVRRAYVANGEAIEVAMIGTQLFGVRLATIARLIPLLVLGYLIATADAFVQRAIRCASGARESASLYYRAKRLKASVLGTTTVAVLVFPGPSEALAIGVPLAAVTGGLARLQWTNYKKHV